MLLHNVEQSKAQIRLQSIQELKMQKSKELHLDVGHYAAKQESIHLKHIIKQIGGYHEWTLPLNESKAKANGQENRDRKCTTSEFEHGSGMLKNHLSSKFDVKASQT